MFLPSSRGRGGHIPILKFKMCDVMHTDTEVPICHVINPYGYDIIAMAQIKACMMQQVWPHI